MKSTHYVYSHGENLTHVLNSLNGLLLWASGQAADLQWFQFGNRVVVEGRSGKKTIGEIALHVQCAWRIRRGDEILLASRNSDRAKLEREYVVRSVECGAAGSFTLNFDDEYALEVFPDDSLGEEHWRILVFGASP